MENEKLSEQHLEQLKQLCNEAGIKLTHQRLEIFNPASVVPGIGFSPDKMLQGRLFSYGDAQRYRLGVNHQQIPVNAPRCPFHNYHRDGAMRVDGNQQKYHRI